MFTEVYRSDIIKNKHLKAMKGRNRVTGKFTKKEKIILLCALAAIILTIIVRVAIGNYDKDILVTLGFINMLMYIVFIVAALFPAEWNMTDKQKSKIKDMDKYQDRHRFVFVIVNMVLTVGIDVGMWFVC